MRCTRAEQAYLRNTSLIRLPKICAKIADADPSVVTCSAVLGLPLVLHIRERNLTCTSHSAAQGRVEIFIFPMFHLPGRSQFAVVQGNNEEEILVPGELEHPNQ